MRRNENNRVLRDMLPENCTMAPPPIFGRSLNFDTTSLRNMFNTNKHASGPSAFILVVCP